MRLQRADAVGQIAGRQFPDGDGAGRGRAAARSCDVSAASIASIGELGPSSAEARRATSAATSLIRSRKREFSTRSDAQVSSVSRFSFPSSRARRSRSSRCAQFGLQLNFLGLEFLAPNLSGRRSR